MASSHFVQEPVAIIGFACRLPGGNTNPTKLWSFLENGGVASNKVPKSRFNIDGHWDGSHKPRTMRPLGGMFLDGIDPADFDASFFQISKVEAISMDPNQRQMLEVVFEGLENSGVTLESLDGGPVGCFVGSFASDYADMQTRDPEDRPANITASNAPIESKKYKLTWAYSMTIDTACSGSMIGVDVACRYLHSREIDTAIIATSNLYLNPEHVMDTGAVGNAHSPTGLCHTFDVSADGYVKAEAVSSLIIKRLSDAIRDGDPIRAVIRGSANNSDGRTPGIASPSAEAQAVAIRSAYANAGITDFNGTAYLECHGTGTQAGDPTEVGGASSVFAATRSADTPLIIGSIKSNVGHAEPAAGISGLMKATMAIEKGLIPGNPTFENPSPKIDFASWKVKASRTALPWPECSIRRASVNSFGYGGSNVHVVIEQAPAVSEGPRHVSSYLSDDDDFDFDRQEADRPSLLVFSANDETTLKSNVNGIATHLMNPRVSVDLADLAYTLSEKRSKLFRRGFITTKSTDLDESSLTTGKKKSETPRIGFVFTGQGAQWPQMGKDLVTYFPSTRLILDELDQVLQGLPQPPTWSLLSELIEPRTAEHLRQPEFSQPLVTALQICMLAVLKDWGIAPQCVVGHSSGEIAAAYASGHLSRSDAIKAAFYRGRAALNCKSETESNVGMLAVGLGAEAVAAYLKNYEGNAWIACYNSPSSLTISGRQNALEALRADISGAGFFARLLQVDLAYHSKLMGVIGEEYQALLDNAFNPFTGSTEVVMYSSVHGTKMTDKITDTAYWRANMVSPVRFDEALTTMLSDTNAPNFLIEIGPSGALSGPISQIRKALPGQGSDVSYFPTWSRGAGAGKSIFDLAGHLFVAGGSVNLAHVNEYDTQAVLANRPRTIIDLPNYHWNHSIKYWHENASSKDWRFKRFVNHDLLGSKILGTSWKTPTWRKLLNLADIPWLKDHKMGPDVLMPGSGYITMALEALYQKTKALDTTGTYVDATANDLCYRFRDTRFDKALVLEDGKESEILLTLTQQPGPKVWHEFRISSINGDNEIEHCSGLVRLQDPIGESAIDDKVSPLRYPTSGQMWYRAQTEAGYGFGPSFQKLLSVESRSGRRHGRSLVSLSEPESKWDPQSYYPIHPAALDGCFQTVTPSLWAGERSSINAVLVPSIIDDLVPVNLTEGLSVASSEYTGRGRTEEAKSYLANCAVYGRENSTLLMRMSGLRFAKLDTGVKVDPHVFNEISWKPDITFMTQDRLDGLLVAESENKHDYVIDLVAHKKPALNVLEINLDLSDSSCMWFEAGDAASRASYLRYDFASSDARNLIGVQTAHESKRNSAFYVIKPDSERLGLTEGEYNLVIVKMSSDVDIDVTTLTQNIKPLLAPSSFVLWTQHEAAFIQSESASEHENESVNGVVLPSTPRFSGHNSTVITPTRSILTVSDAIATPPTVSTPASSAGDTSDLQVDKKMLAEFAQNPSDEAFVSKKVQPLMAAQELGTSLEIPMSTSGIAAYLTRVKAAELDNTARRDLVVARFQDGAPELSTALRVGLEENGWNVLNQTCSFPDVTSKSVVLVLDELDTPVMTKIGNQQWEGLKALISTGAVILWVTQGAQYQVTNPDTALAHGLFRVVRMEDANAKLVCLDVQSSTAEDTTAGIITELLASLRGEWPKKNIETEFAEREGLLYIHRLVPDLQVNEFKRQEAEGAEPVPQSLRENPRPVSLRVERLGTFQSLTWNETNTSEVPVQDGRVEVEIMAVGVNFKDVAVTMGIVPENEYTLGYEASGVVTRLGPGVTKFKVGERVCFLNNGSYANRLQVPTGRAHAIPDSMSFEDAATIPSVYLASMYSLFDMANLKKGQSVLIHSASGGVDISAIQLAQYIGAKIYVTVGTEEKRNFLAENFGGRGVDVILNSLTGEMLDESWRICADGGIMVEIGKKDIVDRNSLSMEPFDRNCSFRAMDFSYTNDISDALIERSIFDLVNSGHIGPVHPITTFGFDEVGSALAYIRSGRHMGKVVVSDMGRRDVEVPIRPALDQLCLRGDASYLIVGGLKGLCGNLAIHMARHGAKHIIVCSRTYGCAVTEAKGDAGNRDFVEKVFSEATPAVAGVIMGAMVLRDKPYETMSLEEYHAAIYGKVHGTWNLHHVSLQQSQPLEFFTMLSSISGIVGKKGQTNYSAGNTFLDAFAYYRQSLGLRANTVDLGLIEDVGYIAEQGGMDSHFDRTHRPPLSTVPQSAQLVTGISFPLPSHSDLSREARFAHLFVASSAGASAGEGSQADQEIRTFLMMVKAKSDRTALAKMAVELLVSQLTKILRLETEMEPAKSLLAYGTDSLAAVELRNWVRVELGAELTTLDITNAASINSLAEKLVSKIPESAAAS
ncbi:polyketide synthase [Astrocystis sublimbata]|nr:polyketide synthase [Astrocystis sublimbata]